jgi:hypothetical protein
MPTPGPYELIGGAVVFVIVAAVMGGMLGAIINKTGC